MEREINKSNKDIVTVKINMPGEITLVSLKLPESVEYDDWKTLGINLFRLQGFSNWAIGDWLLYGEGKYGEMYKLATSMLSIDENRLALLKYVSSRVDSSVRSFSLSWSHHRMVAKLHPKEQSKWLKKAASQKWNVNQLRTALGQDSMRVGLKYSDLCPCCNAKEATMKVCSDCATNMSLKVNQNTVAA